MKKYLVFATLAFVVSFFPVAAHALFKATKFTVNVVDGRGEPIPGIRVGVGFEKNTGWGTDSAGQRGITDADGRLTFSGQSNGHITYGGSKEGYYPSYYDYDFKDLGPFGWKPWNPELKIVMRKIENPVPMYARDTKTFKKSIAIPVVGKNIGFDLIVYDWVAPYGQGRHSDFVFHLEKSFTNMANYNGRLRITFTNKNDGIVKVTEKSGEGSAFKLPRFGTETGYENELRIETGQGLKRKWIKGFNSNDNYLFRVRSEVEDGEVVRAMYGKILGPILLEPRIEPSEIYFKYYLNPDYTRNLEFDPNRNLFKNLKHRERVGIK